MIGRIVESVRGRRLPILAYHSVSDDFHDTLTVSCAAFAMQMARLAARGIAVISLDEATSRLKHGEDLSKRVVITFDDGYLDFLQNAHPVLAAHGFSATMFVVAAGYGRSADWLGRAAPRPTLSPPEVREVAALGYAIGSHSTTHAHLERVTEAQLADEVGGSKAALEDVLGSSVPSFAYPYGQFSLRESEAVAAADYACACGTAGVWANGPETDAFGLSRHVINPRHTLVWFDEMTSAGFRARLLRSALHVRVREVIAQARAASR